MRRIGRKLAATVLAGALTIGMADIARADNVQNDVVAEGNGTIVAGGTTIVDYRIHATGGDTTDTTGKDGQNCNPAVSPVTVTIHTPTAVSVDNGSGGNTLTFTTCGSDQPVTFSSSTAGTHSITVTTNEAVSGDYNEADAAFTLTVVPTAPSNLSATPGDTKVDLQWTASTANGLDGYKIYQDGVFLRDETGTSTSVTGLTNETNYCFSVKAYKGSLLSAAAGPQCATPTAPIVTPPTDTTGPTVNCGSALSGWFASDQSVACTASDSGSGLADESQSSFSLTTNLTAGTESNNASTNSVLVCDNAGNCTTAGPVSGFKIDKKAPGATCGSSDSIWHADNQSVSCSASDAGSGLAAATPDPITLETNVSSGSETSNAQTNSLSICDAVNNCTTAGPVGPFKIDRRAPEVSCGTADSDWHATNQSVTCSATEGGSGLAAATPDPITLETTVSSGSETSNAQTNSLSICDAVNNCTTAGPVGPFKIDRKAPTDIVFDGSIDPGDSFYFGFVPQNDMTCSATDGGSGFDRCDITGYSSAVGSHTLTATALDNVSNSSTATRNYRVLAWTAKGFYQPVDKLPTVNIVKNGSTVPLKFEVFAGTTELTKTDVVSTFKVTRSDCTSGGTTDDIENYSTGGTSLRYDETGGQFIQNWQVPKGAGQCYQVVLTLDDGSVIEASFKTK